MKKERNLGIDLLRMICMNMIVLHHVLDNSGLSTGVEMFSANYGIVWLLQSATHCAVNCYGLISGYVYADSDFKMSNIIRMWLQVFFYTMGIVILFAVFMPGSVDKEVLKVSLFPVLTEHYWYFTQYFCMFFFIPILNLILKTWNSGQFKRFLLVIIILFSAVNLFVYTNLFNIDNGFSAIWLAFMYLIGGYIKKNPEFIRWKKGRAIAIYTICVLLTSASKWLIQFATIKISGQPSDGSRFLLYTSPTMILCAIALLVCFSRLEINHFRKVIQFFGPLSFAVYIIHANVLIGRYFMKGLLGAFVKANPLIFFCVVIFAAEMIYLVCSIIDFGRVKLFKLLRVGKLCEQIEKIVFYVTDRILKLFDSLFERI